MYHFRDSKNPGLFATEWGMSKFWSTVLVFFVAEGVRNLDENTEILLVSVKMSVRCEK